MESGPGGRVAADSSRAAAERNWHTWTLLCTRRCHFRHHLHVGDGTAQQLRAPCVAKRTSSRANAKGEHETHMKPRAHKPVPDVTRPQRVLACRRHLFRHDARPSPCEPTPFAPQMCGLSGSCSRILCKLGAVSCEKNSVSRVRRGAVSSNVRCAWQCCLRWTDRRRVTVKEQLRLLYDQTQSRSSGEAGGASCRNRKQPFV